LQEKGRRREGDRAEAEEVQEAFGRASEKRSPMEVAEMVLRETEGGRLQQQIYWNLMAFGIQGA
jgi:hypothetical protein